MKPKDLFIKLCQGLINYMSDPKPNHTILTCTPPRDAEDAIRRNIQSKIDTTFYDYPTNTNELMKQLLEEHKECKSIYYVHSKK